MDKHDDRDTNGQTFKKMKTDFTCIFLKIVPLTVFLCSFLLFARIEKMLGKHLGFDHEAVILSFTLHS